MHSLGAWQAQQEIEQWVGGQDSADTSVGSKSLFELVLQLEHTSVFLSMDRSFDVSTGAAPTSGLTAGLQRTKLRVAVGDQLQFRVELGEIVLADSNEQAHFPRLMHNCSSDAVLLKLEGFIVDQQRVQCVLHLSAALLVVPVVGCVQDLTQMLEPLLHGTSSAPDTQPAPSAAVGDSRDGWAHKLPKIDISIIVDGLSVFFPARGTTQSYGHGTVLELGGSIYCKCERQSQGDGCCAGRGGSGATVHYVRGGKDRQQLHLTVTSAVVTAGGSADSATVATLDADHQLQLADVQASAVLSSLVVELTHSVHDGELVHGVLGMLSWVWQVMRDWQLRCLT